MGLAFVGGFASGMSKSIEKARDRALRDKNDKEALSVQNNKIQNDLDNNAAKLLAEGQKRLFSLHGEKVKASGDKYDGAEESRVDHINAINQEMRSVWKTTNEGIANSGSAKTPILDIQQYDTADIGTVNNDGENYVVRLDLADSVLKDENVKLVGNEIHNKVFEDNGKGVMIPVKDANGNDTWEDSGHKLKKYSDTFRGSEAKAPTIAKIKAERYIKYVENEKINNRVPKSPEEYAEAEKNKATGSVAIESNRYANKLKAGKAEFNEDTALGFEDTLKDKWSPKTKEDVNNLDKQAVLEQEYDEFQASWKMMIDSGEYESGIIATTIRNLGEYGGEKFQSLVGLSGEEISAKIKVDALSGDLLARYIKLMSGLAVSNFEREFLQDVMFGSKYKDQNARLEKFQNFTAAKKSTNTKTAKQLLHKAPHTAGKYLYGGKIPVKKNAETKRDREYWDKTIRDAKPNWSNAMVNDALKSKGF